MQLTGADAKKFELGDLNVEKGAQSNVSAASVGLKKSGMDKLREIGRKYPHFKANG